MGCMLLLFFLVWEKKALSFWEPAHDCLWQSMDLSPRQSQSLGLVFGTVLH